MASQEFIIAPSNTWFRLPLREILRYRDLLFLLVRKDLVARYKQTVLGPLWFIFQPVVNTVVFTVVFQKMAGLGTAGLPGPLFYFSGMLAWQYFAQCMQGTSATFTGNAGLFGKVYFPRLIMPLATVLSNLLSYLLVLATFMCFWLYYKFFSGAGSSFALTVHVVALPLIVIQTAALGLGIGLWMSAMTAKYRDFTQLSGFLSQLWMFATLPLFTSEVPARMKWLLAANPVCSIVDWYRMAFLGSGSVDPVRAAVSVGVTALILLSGIVVFSRVERTFIDTI